MFGKIFGIGLLALIHASVMIVTAIVAAKVVGLDVLDGFRIADLAVGLVWFLLGYALYCCAFAAGGSLISRPEDAQGVALPIMLPLILGYIIGFSASEGPNTLLWVLSYFPPTAVLCMPVLSATGAVAGLGRAVEHRDHDGVHLRRGARRGEDLRAVDPQDRQARVVARSVRPACRRSRLTV